MNLVSDPRSQAVNRPEHKRPAFKRPFASLTDAQKLAVLQKHMDLTNPCEGYPPSRVGHPDRVRLWNAASRLGLYIHDRPSSAVSYRKIQRRQAVDGVLEQAYQVLQAAQR